VPNVFCDEGQSVVQFGISFGNYFPLWGMSGRCRARSSTSFLKCQKWLDIARHGLDAQSFPTVSSDKEILASM
jgi:hypothetical protein